MLIGDDPILARVSFKEQSEFIQLAESLDIWEVDHEQNFAIADLEGICGSQPGCLQRNLPWFCTRLRNRTASHPGLRQRHHY